MFYIIILILSINFSLTQECPPIDTLSVNSPQDNWSLPYINNWDELEIMTWNIKTFPLTNNTVSDVSEILSDLLPDIINFQEINSNSAFQELIELLPVYDFIYYDDEYYGLAIAYRIDSLELINSTTLFNNYGWEFTWRYPLSANFRWSCGNAVVDFEMINVHLKCCDNGFDQRLAASQILDQYIQNQTINNEKVIVAGDYNDSLTDSNIDNSLLPLISNDEIIFVDNNLAENSSYYWSYPSWPSHIDHILINDIFGELISDAEIVRLDDYVGYSYSQNNISDHRPVYWSYYVPTLNSGSGLIINEIMNNPNVVNDSFGEWIELTNISNEEIDLYNFIIKDNDNDYHVINEHIIIQPDDFKVFGISNDETLNGNIHMDYQYANFFLNNFIDEIIIQHPNGSVIDQVVYDYNVNFENVSGRSIMLINPSLDNTLGSNWLASNIQMNNGDYGTPGQSNMQSCNNTGDLNSDLEINIVDVILMVNFILGIDNQYDVLCFGDIDSNNEINIIDVVLLVEYILGNN